MSTYRYDVQVRRWNHYGDKVVARFPASILAADVSEVTAKVRAMFNATYDDFRHFWSHDWTLNSVTEVEPAPEPIRSTREEPK